MKKLLLFTLLLCFFFQGFSQNTAYYDRMEHIFGNIDKTKVTTGFLKEFGIRFNDVEAYNGVIAPNNFVDKTQLQSLYSSLYTMRVGTAAENMAAPNMLFNNTIVRTKSRRGAPPEVLLSALYYNYQQYKTNAYTTGDVTISNDRIYDVAGRNPYDTKKVFAVTPLKQELQGSTFSFKLPSEFMYTNAGSTLNQVQIDFGNGDGYQTVTLNASKSVTYSSGGEKEIKAKFTYSGGITLYSHSKISVNYIPNNSGPLSRINGSGVTTKAITGDSWQGSSATGFVTTELAAGHEELTKPLIVVEGFDPYNSFDYFDLINRDNPGGLKVKINNTGLTLNQAIEDEGYDLVFVNFANSTDYIQRNALMVEAVIDWVNEEKVGDEKNVVLGMSMGGLVARYALRDMEIHNKTHETKLYISHDAPHQGANVPVAFQAMVRHLVGENVSLPVFLSLIDVNIVGFADVIPDLEDGLDLLETPAAKQMLIYQLQGTGENISVDNYTLHNSFLTEYSNMGYSQKEGIRNIAIANGSECGSPLGFSPYDNLVDVNEKIDLPIFLSNIALGILNGISINPLKIVTSALSTDTDIKVQFNAKALPNQQSKQVYKGKLFIKKTVLFVIDVEEPLIDEGTLNSTASMLPLDNAGGGIYDLEAFINLPPEVDSYVKEKQFNFIPTFSSLDIGGGDQEITYPDLTKAYSPLAPPLAPKNTPFDNFYTNPITSEGHTQFTLKNGNWLLDELDDDNIPAFYSDISICSSAELPLDISGGADRVCYDDSLTFELSNLNPNSNATVNWSVSSNLIIVSSTNTTVVVKAVNNSAKGDGTITATVNGFVVTKTVHVGRPTVVYGISGNSGDKPVKSTSSFHVNMVNNNAYHWSISTLNSDCGLTPPGNPPYNTTPKFLGNGGNLSATATGSSVTVFWGSCTGNYKISCSAVNSCGSTGVGDKTVEVVDGNPGGGGDGCPEDELYTYPNPVSQGSDLTVNIIDPGPCIDPDNIQSQSSNQESINQTNSNVVVQTWVKIYDLNGIQKYTGTFTGNNFNITGLNLSHGLYVIHVNTSAGFNKQEMLAVE